MWHSLYPSPIRLMSDFEDVRKSEKVTGVNVQMVVHSDTAPLSTLPFPNAGQVRDLALTSPFRICCPARLLGRLITHEGITASKETTIQCSMCSCVPSDG